MKEKMKKWSWLVLCLFGIATCLIVIFKCSGTSRSYLIDKEHIPDHCKMYLECMYFNQKSEGKAACSTFAPECKKVLTQSNCEKNKDLYSGKDDEAKFIDCTKSIN